MERGLTKQELRDALRSCESEPIHRPGSIQPLGVLLALDDQLIVRHVSRNIASLFGRTTGEVLGRPFADLVGHDQAKSLHELVGLEEWRRTAITEFTLTRGDRHSTFDAQVSHQEGLWIVEIETEERWSGDLFQRLFIPVRDALWELDAENDLGRYTGEVVRQVRLLTGYDRVMMYLFDANWDGEVIAESKRDGVVSYLGNRFPASDIPAQARELYVRNPSRLIADVAAEAVSIEPLLTPATGRPLDMTFSAFRQLSPVHLEYLRNMRVRASLSISLIQNSRLWGLIACHHSTPKHVPLRTRELYEFIGKTVSLKLSNLENNSKIRFYETVHRLLDVLTEEIRGHRDEPAVLDRYESELLGLVQASGAVIVIDGQRRRFGDTPDDEQLNGLEQCLRGLPPATVFHADTLIGICPAAAEFSGRISGMMLAPLNDRLDNYIAWFRPGILRTVKWAGRPVKTVRLDDGRPRIAPRQSFEAWVETVRNSSPPWTSVDIEAAKALSLAVINVLTHSALEVSEENYRRLAEYSSDMIAQIDQGGTFSYVSPASRALLGYDAEQMLGRPGKDFVAAEDHAALDQALARLTTQDLPVTVLIRMVHSEGAVKWIECTLKRMQDRMGASSAVINARDVTERHTYQLAIEDLHRRNAQILEAAGEGLISIDEAGLVTFANDRSGQILGRPAGTMLGQPLRDIIGDSPVFEAFRRHESQHRALDHFTCADGHTVPVRYVGTPIPSDRGSAGGGILVFSVQADAGANDDRQLAHTTVLEQTSEAVMVTDPDGRIVSVNRAFTRVTGYTAEEAMGQTPKILKSGVHTPNFYQVLWASLLQRRHWAGEIWNRRKNGEIYPQWGSITAIVDEAEVVRNYVAVFSDSSKAKQAEERLFYLANHDTLTGLPNRNRFVEHLGGAIERGHRSGRRLAVAFIDLDRFKIINDTLGHAAGDQYLKEIGRRIVSASRQQDMLSRWGGDEFVLLLEDVADPNAAAEAIRRVQAGITRPLDIDGHEVTPTASIGISLFPDDGDDVNDLIKAADTAMYRIKERERNGFEFYTRRLTDEIERKFEIVTELRGALRKNQLELYYQPQVDGAGDRMMGVEALVRWHHPERGLLLPGSFIPLAEDLGLIVEVGDWVLNEACRQMAAWVRAGVPVPRVAINVAPSQLKPEFPELVRRTLEKFMLAPGYLELEITDGALERGAQVLPVLQQLRELGVSLSVDDFGTGYSSLSHLKNFPLTSLKIDKSFIDGIPGSTQDIAIIKAVLALGSSLDLEVVAEGVETEEQLEFLHSLGRISIQGYVRGRPVPSERIVRDLAAGTQPQKEALVDIWMRLRTATRAAHQAIERLPALVRVFADDYRRTELAELFIGLLAIHEPLEAVLAGSPEAAAVGYIPRSPLLHTDLGRLGARPAGLTSTPIPDYKSAAARMGGLYVIEGAILGGQVIRRRLLRQFGGDIGEALTHL